MRHLFLITLSIFLIVGLAQAQDPEQSWGNLRTLQAGQKIQVVDQKLRSQEGVFVGFSDEAISLRVDQDTVSIDRGDVLRVSSRKHMSRGKHALIGLAIGAGAGLGIGGGLASVRSESDEKVGVAGVVGLGIFGAGVGGGIGAALPAGQPTIYRAERRQTQPAP